MRNNRWEINLASEICKELEETTRKIKNEAYKHIKAIENTRINMFQVAVSIVLVPISTLIVLIANVDLLCIIPSPINNMVFK